MVSSELEANQTFLSTKRCARQFVLGPSIVIREQGLEGLCLTDFSLEIARKVISLEDWGPRVAGLQAAATYHAQMQSGIMAAAIAVVVRDLFDEAARRAPDEIRAIARQAITSVATDFSYGVLRAEFPGDAVAWADELKHQLLSWDQTNAALTVETLAAEALYVMNRFDDAIERLPKVGPSDQAGQLRYERLKRLIYGLRPSASRSDALTQYERVLTALESLYAAIPSSHAYAAKREKIGEGIKREKLLGAPRTEAECLHRVVSIEELLATAKEL